MILDHDIAGAGPLLVLIHGITENRRAWDPIDLTDAFTVLRVDVRGHGGSAKGPSYDPRSLAGDVYETVESVAPGIVPIIVGHSMGGIIATAYAVDHPTAGVINVDQPLALGDLQAQVQKVAPLLRSPLFKPLVGMLFKQYNGELGRDEGRRLQKLRAPQRDVVLGVWQQLIDDTPEELAAAVEELVSVPGDVPYLVIAGLDPGEQYESWLQSKIPQVQYEVWSPSTHYPHLADPARFTARVKSFAAEL